MTINLKSVLIIYNTWNIKKKIKHLKCYKYFIKSPPNILFEYKYYQTHFSNFKNISKFCENIFKLKIIFKIIIKHTLIHM